MQRLPGTTTQMSINSTEAKIELSSARGLLVIIILIFISLYSVSRVCIMQALRGAQVNVGRMLQKSNKLPSMEESWHKDEIHLKSMQLSEPLTSISNSVCFNKRGLPGRTFGSEQTVNTVQRTHYGLNIKSSSETSQSLLCSCVVTLEDNSNKLQQFHCRLWFLEKKKFSSRFSSFDASVQPVVGMGAASRRKSVRESCDCGQHLVPPEVVDHHHAGQVQHHAQALEGDHGEPQGAVLPHQAGRVVTAIGAALAARQALDGHVGGVVSVRALLLTWAHWHEHHLIGCHVWEDYHFN